MPFNYRKHLKELDEFAGRRVVEIYEKADRIMQDRMRNTLSSQLNKNLVNQTITFNEKVINAALAQTQKPIQDTVKQSYLLGVDNIQSAVKGAAVGITFEQLSIAEKEQIQALMQEIYLQFGQTLTVVSRESRNVLNAALRRQIREKVATGVLTGDSMEVIARELRDQIFTPSGITAFTKKNGARMSLKEYTRMISRTMVMKSANEGSMTRMANLGLTVFQISTHGGACEICVPHEGKIYDTTGKKYPKPQESDYPIFHPNCRHIIQARPELQYL